MGLGLRKKIDKEGLTHGLQKLGRTSDQRKAMLRDLATSLIISERIETTEARAKFAVLLRN